LEYPKINGRKQKLKEKGEKKTGFLSSFFEYNNKKKKNKMRKFRSL